MRDVANRAGVSLATVSHVLNKTRYTSPETERKVLNAVRELNYHTNVHARRLAMKRSDLFGLVISEIANPYFPEIIKGFQTAAWERGFDVLLCNTEYSAERTKASVRKLIESDVRAVAIMTSAVDRDATAALTEAGAGLVFYNAGSPEELVSTITINYLSGISQAIRHAMGLGHRNVAIIAGPQDNPTAVTLKRALVSGLRQWKLKDFPVLESNFRVDGGAAAIRTLLSQSEIPTLVFCGNDLIAMGAMSELEEAGVRVPADVSVVGFDDIFFASLARPPLTTVHIPRERMGRVAFEALDKMMNLKSRRGKNYSIETALVVRKSTAPPRKHDLRP
ncbi:MAG TPA: LacI family DNA-binding transcriptional regulator [Bryobacteraceae bacterium]|jgi:LacI family transcriptional regulator|nr:LacI family DNA-binding transcriptional regulator [Bryobacteraceae bacterium]